MSSPWKDFGGFEGVYSRGEQILVNRVQTEGEETRYSRGSSSDDK